MLVNLARGFADLGVRVDFLVKTNSAPYLDQLQPKVNLKTLGTGRRRELVKAVQHYLLDARPALVMATKLKDTAIGVAAARLCPAAIRSKIVLRVGTHYTAQREGRHFWQSWRQLWRVRRLCHQVDSIICVSAGVAEDLSRYAKVPVESLIVLKNPVITAKLIAQRNQSATHPWFGPGQPDVILGVGRLSKSKNFALLIRAFATTRERLDCRLIILGDGRQRQYLQDLAAQLGIAEQVDFPGFVDNPYAFMTAARVFVLSSLWEGSPNVLVEAMGCGTPVIATDCPSGPREIISETGCGQLIPMNNAAALAAAISSAFAAPPQRAATMAAAQPYEQLESCRAYLRALGVTVADPG